MQLSSGYAKKTNEYQLTYDIDTRYVIGLDVLKF